MRDRNSCQSIRRRRIHLQRIVLLAAALLSSAPLVAADSLSDRIDRILKRNGLASSDLSIKIVSIPDGRVFYEKNPDRALNPASNVKLITMAAALKELGPSFTFPTEFYSDTLMGKDGRIHHLWIKGYGDPLFVTEELEDLVEQMKAAGLKSVDGDVYVDDTYFDRHGLTTYIADADGKPSHIVTGPLSFNYNLQPDGQDPAVYTGTVITETLRRHGIAVEGSLKREAVPARTLLLFTHSSKPLREILKSLGKSSNNFTAEQLVKTISARRFGPPGSIPKGLKVLREYLESLGISKKKFVLDNGSGLTRLSQVSASDFIRVLYDVYASPWRDDFVASLSVAGVDGTLARKFRGGRMTGKMYAKTGTLNDVKALSGYVFDQRARLAFSFLFNDFGEAVPMDNIAKAEEEVLETVLDEF